MKKLGLSQEEIPSSAELWKKFLENIERFYEQADQDRYTLERSLMISSEEMRELYGAQAKSLSALQATLESSTDGILVVSNEGEINAFNEKFISIWEIPREVIDLKENRFVLEYASKLVRHPGRFQENAARVWSHSGLDSDIIELKNGKIIERYSFPHQMDGQVIGRVQTFRDITERHRTTEQLRVYTSRFISLVENIPGGNLVEDENNHVVYVNEEFCNLFNLHSKNDLIGLDHQKIIEVIKPLFTDSAQFIQSTDQILRARKPVLREEFQFSEGKILERNYIPIVSDGFYRGHYWQYRDTTDSKALETRLRASDRMATVGFLAAGLGHEINNPLTYVLGHLELTKQKLTKFYPAIEKTENREELQLVRDELGNSLESSREGCDRISRIVKDLKTFSTHRESEVEEASIIDVLELSIRMADNEIKHRALVVRDYEIIPIVMSDRSKLGQVFLNLLINAAQSIPIGNVNSNKITIRTRVEKDSGILVEVVDTGEGIPEKYIKNIFEPFFTTKISTVGTGLGLSICRNIIESIGGRLDVTSEVGEGTCFSVRIPAIGLSEFSSKGAEKEVLRPDRGHAVKRIVVIDDEEMICEVFESVLGKDYDVKAYHNGKLALNDLLRDDAWRAYDLIICDLMMPEMTGIEFFETLGKVDPDLSKKTIFMTGGAFTEQARLFLNQFKKEQILEKPFNFNRLKKLLRSM